MDEHAAIAALVRSIGDARRRIADDELARLRAYLANHTLARPNRAQVDAEVGGHYWIGRVVMPGEWMDRRDAKYLKHVVGLGEWPDGTTVEEYMQSLFEALMDPGAGLAIERDVGSWKLTFAARSRQWRGPLGGPYIVVPFLPEKDLWLTGFQPEQGLTTIERHWRTAGGRWLRTPR